MNVRNAIKLTGAARLSDENAKRTKGKFSTLINENRDAFRRYFGVDLFPGSLNIDVPTPTSLQRDLDAGAYEPAFVIPRAELVGMPSYIGDGQAWSATLRLNKSSVDVTCWIFRRIGSRVPAGVIEVVACEKLRTTYGIANGDAVELTFLVGSGPSPD